MNSTNEIFIDTVLVLSRVLRYFILNIRHVTTMIHGVLLEKKQEFKRRMII